MPARDLSDAELDELQRLLDATPAPYRPLDGVGLDGYLCGVLVQPRLVPADDWLPGVFDVDGAALPARADREGRARCEALVTRRLDALRESLEAHADFDPLLPAPLDDAKLASEQEAPSGLRPASRALVPWVEGFSLAVQRFGDPTSASSEEGDRTALARVLRHLPPQDDAQRALQAQVEARWPIADEAAAVDDLVAAVADLYDATHAPRWQVQTVRRAAPKVGRNDPCPCGSGRKWKLCHGASAPG